MISQAEFPLERFLELVVWIICRSCAGAGVERRVTCIVRTVHPGLWGRISGRGIVILSCLINGAALECPRRGEIIHWLCWWPVVVVGPRACHLKAGESCVQGGQCMSERLLRHLFNVGKNIGVPWERGVVRVVDVRGQVVEGIVYFCTGSSYKNRRASREGVRMRP